MIKKRVLLVVREDLGGWIHDVMSQLFLLLWEWLVGLLDSVLKIDVVFTVSEQFESDFHSREVYTSLPAGNYWFPRGHPRHWPPQTCVFKAGSPEICLRDNGIRFYALKRLIGMMWLPTGSGDPVTDVRHVEGWVRIIGHEGAGGVLGWVRWCAWPCHAWPWHRWLPHPHGNRSTEFLKTGILGHILTLGGFYSGVSMFGNGNKNKKYYCIIIIDNELNILKGSTGFFFSCLTLLIMEIWIYVTNTLLNGNWNISACI